MLVLVARNICKQIEVNYTPVPGTWNFCNTIKADSHTTCLSHAASMPFPCRSQTVNSHMPCCAPAMLRQWSTLREIPRGSRKYPNCLSNSLTDRLFVVSCCHSLQSWVWIVVMKIGILLIPIFVQIRVVTGRSRTPACSPQAVSRRPWCAVALRRTAWSSKAWTWHGKCESDTAALCESNGEDTF